MLCTLIADYYDFEYAWLEGTCFGEFRQAPGGYVYESLGIRLCL